MRFCVRLHIYSMNENHLNVIIFAGILMMNFGKIPTCNVYYRLIDKKIIIKLQPNSCAPITATIRQVGSNNPAQQLITNYIQILFKKKKSFAQCVGASIAYRRIVCPVHTSTQKTKRVSIKNKLHYMYDM